MVCRYAVDLATMMLSNKALSVASGEWACHGGSNHDEPMDGVPTVTALVEVIWHDYYRNTSLTLQVPSGSLRRALATNSGPSVELANAPTP